MIMIDTEMPTCCEGCFAQQEYYNQRFDETEYSCGINGEDLGTHSRQDWGEWHYDRPEWCPLKEQEVMSPDDFKEKLLSMFSSIWDCEIEHPIFQDKVGELMGAVIQLYKQAVKRE